MDGFVIVTYELDQADAAVRGFRASATISAPALAYDATWTSGDFRCRSEIVGVACRSIRSGYGFFLSRDRQEPLEPA